MLFVAAGAVLSRIIGILRTSLSLTAGMLTGALLLDLLVPTSGAVVAPLTVLGTALTFVGLVVVSLPWKRRASTPETTTAAALVRERGGRRERPGQRAACRPL